MHKLQKGAFGALPPHLYPIFHHIHTYFRRYSTVWVEETALIEVIIGRQ